MTAEMQIKSLYERAELCLRGAGFSGFYDNEDRGFGIDIDNEDLGKLGYEEVSKLIIYFRDNLELWPPYGPEYKLLTLGYGEALRAAGFDVVDVMEPGYGYDTCHCLVEDKK